MNAQVLLRMHCFVGKMRIAVVGGGPSGSFAAQQLAKQGHDVQMFEENPEIGIPCHCTGLVTKVLWDLIPKKKELIVNELNRVRVHAPDGTVAEIPLQEFVLDRAGLDKHLANKAADAGVRINYKHRFLDIQNQQMIVQHQKVKKKLKADILIGADGPRSQVAKATGLFGTRQYYIGMQATAVGEFEPDTFDVWFGGICPGFFAWLVPESSAIARIGIAAREHPHKYFEPFVRTHAKKILSYQGGPIPLYNPGLRQQSLQSQPRTYLVGDAGGLCKATTGGGIITGMLSGKTCAQAIVQEKNYETLLRPLKKELWIHQKLRNTLNKFSDVDYNKLVTLMKKEQVQEILATHPREYPSQFMLKLLIAQPRFAGFIKYVFS